MAFALQAEGGDEESAGTNLADINVTPLVDVMLVLLVIFMVTAPLINQSQVDVKLPESKTGHASQQTESAVISVDQWGNVWIDDRKLTAVEFETKFQSIIAARKPKTVYLRGAETAQYGTVVKVMDELRLAGVTNLGMITQPAAAGAAPTPHK